MSTPNLPCTDMSACNTPANRAAYERIHRLTLDRRHEVHHSCNKINPLCSDPAHLVAVTPQAHRRSHESEAAVQAWYDGPSRW